MKKIISVIVLTAVFLLSCSDDREKTYYSSKFNITKKIIEVDSLLFFNNDSIYINQIHDINIWKDRILITDKGLNKVFIYDDRLKIVKDIGGKGGGPEEFLRTPVVLLSSDSIHLIDPWRKKIYSYSDNFEFISSKNLPGHLFYQYYKPLKIRDNIIYHANIRGDISNISYYEDTHLLYMINTDYEVIKEFYDWEAEYFKRSAFSMNCIGSLIAKKDEDSFFAIQCASWIITHFDYEGNPIKSFGIKPKYFKDPPKDITFDETQKSVEALVKFSAQITNIKKLVYDDKNDLLLVYYFNGTEDRFYKRSDLYSQHYLQIYNKNYNCIFDDKISGILEFTDNGKIYVMTEENPSYIKLKIIELGNI